MGNTTTIDNLIDAITDNTTTVNDVIEIVAKSSCETTTLPSKSKGNLIQQDEAVEPSSDGEPRETVADEDVVNNLGESNLIQQDEVVEPSEDKAPKETVANEDESKGTGQDPIQPSQESDDAEPTGEQQLMATGSNKRGLDLATMECLEAIRIGPPDLFAGLTLEEQAAFYQKRPIDSVLDNLSEQYRSILQTIAISGNNELFRQNTTRLDVFIQEQLGRLRLIWVPEASGPLLLRPGRVIFDIIRVGGGRRVILEWMAMDVDRFYRTARLASLDLTVAIEDFEKNITSKIPRIFAKYFF